MHSYYPQKVRFLTIIGNRPQFVKAAAVSHRLRTRAEEILVHTGQHYDDALSRVFFEELSLPRPEHRLELGGGTNAAQTARMLAALEPLLAAELEPVLGPRQVELVEEHARERVVVVLAGVHEHLVGVPAEAVRHGRRLHELRPVADDCEYTHVCG